MSEDTTFRDALGNKPKIGDIVFTKASYYGFQLCIVIAYTPKKLRVERLKGSRSYQGKGYLVQNGSETLVVTGQLEVTNHLLKGEDSG